jgi:hypothetical protein
MGKPIPTAGYDTRTAAIVAMRNSGMTPREIAEKIGVNVRIVYTLSNFADSAAVDPSKRRRTMRVPISDVTYRRMFDHAARRGLMAHELAARLLDHVLADDLVAAVLDDDKVIV